MIENVTAVCGLEGLSGGLQGKELDEKVVSVANELLNLEQRDCPLVHRFGPGIYIREVFIPADTFAIGHWQKNKHLNIFLKGRVTMLNSDGSTSELKAPMIFTSEPGRKCGYIHEDVVWLNIYATEERDVAKLEEANLDKSGIAEVEQEQISRSVDIGDYKKVLEEYGYTEDQVQKEVQNKNDRIPFPDGGYMVAVGDSNIHGRGLMATGNFKAGDIIAPGNINGGRTPAGRYTNHSINPNANLHKTPSGDIWLVARREIAGMKGGQLGEEITINYRNALELRGVKKCHH